MVYLIHDLIDDSLIVSFLFSEHLHFVFEFFQNVSSIQIIVLLEMLVFFFESFEDFFVLFDFNSKLVIHFHDHFILLHDLIFEFPDQDFLLNSFGRFGTGFSQIVFRVAFFLFGIHVSHFLEKVDLLFFDLGDFFFEVFELNSDGIIFLGE